MTRRSVRWTAAIGVATVGVLMWPGPAHGDTTLGGYSGLASAQPVRIQVYEPTIPIPATPQIDGGIAYTRANTDTGPVSRALASYLWPGDTVGDGFNALVGNDAAKYPVQVNSKYPATNDAPAKNTAQLTDGNGMTTSSDGSTTRARVTGFGVAGTNLLSNPLSGLGNLVSGTPSAAAGAPTALPLPASSALAAVVSTGNVTSDSTISVGAKTLTSTAHAAVSTVSLLSGLITVAGIDVTATSTSNGTTAATSGHSTIGAVTVAGMRLGLGDDGISLGATKTTTPTVPKAVVDTLDRLGITVRTLTSKRTAHGAASSLNATAMLISIDTAPLRTALNLGGLTKPLSDLLGKIPQLGSQLQPVLGLGPRIVLQLGSVESSATAAPAYSGGGVPAGTHGSGGGSGSTTGGGVGGSAVGGGGTGGTGSVGGTTPLAGSVPAAGAGGAGGAGTTPALSTAAYSLPTLGTVPKSLIIAALLLAAALGWALRAGGAVLLGGAGGCDRGLPGGVPDLHQASTGGAPTGGGRLPWRRR